MVRDNVTGLIWEVKTDDGSIHDKGNMYTWCDTDPDSNGGNVGTCGDEIDTEDFVTALNAENYGGFSDWRLPSYQELLSIVNSGRHDPAVDETYFPQTAATASVYWSSTASAGYPSKAWHVSFSEGHSYRIGKSSSGYVRAVRGRRYHSGSFMDNGDDTVTDAATGLMWQQATTPEAYTWEQALSYCEGLSHGGYADWRLPSIHELASLVDLNRFRPAIRTDVFLYTPESNYWSSTPSITGDQGRWVVILNYGEVTSSNASIQGFTRAVRGGQNRLPAPLHILSPLQASRHVVGQMMSISWETRDIEGSVAITLSRDAGKTHEVIVDGTENDGSYDWTVAGPVSANCMLRIAPIGDVSKGTTQGLFVIASTSSPVAVVGSAPDGQTNQTNWELTVMGDSIISYRYRLNDGTWGKETLVSETIDLADLAGGTYTLNAIGRDAAGDWQAEDSPTTVTWTVDLAPPNGPDISGTASTNDTTPTWNWDAGGGGDGTYRYKINDSDLSVDAAETTAIEYTPTTDLAEGSYTLYIQESDDAGNWSDVSSFTVFVDTTRPAITGIADDSNPTQSKTWIWGATDASVVSVHPQIANFCVARGDWAQPGSLS